MYTTEARSRVEPELKREAAAILQGAGLDLSTAIRLFLRHVVETGGLPVELSQPNSITLKAIKASRVCKVTAVPLDEL